MLDGLTLWLTMIGGATIAILAFDGLGRTWRKLRQRLRRRGTTASWHWVKSDD